MAKKAKVYTGTEWVDLAAATTDLSAYQKSNRTGLQLVVPTGATNGTVSANGAVTIGSAVTSVTVQGAFSATYDNYKIIISGGSASANGLLRLQLSGATSGYYSGTAGANLSNGTYAGLGTNNGSLWDAAGIHLTNDLVMNVDLLCPFLTKKKWLTANFVNFNSFNSYGQTVGECSVSSSLTGFVISPTSGNISGGTIRIYGYNNGL